MLYQIAFYFVANLNNMSKKKAEADHYKALQWFFIWNTELERSGLTPAGVGRNHNTKRGNAVWEQLGQEV